MAAERWEFWIDVGGTFTDCLARSPDGSLLRHKLLSSSVIKGRAAAGSSRDAIVDPHRSGDPPDFWVGWQLSIVDEAGQSIDSAKVTKFDRAAGRLSLHGLAHSPALDAPYELSCGEEAPVVAIRYLLGL